MKRLYFDIDGTLLEKDSTAPKTALSRGRFELAVRRARFRELVCVSNFVAVIRQMRASDPDYDGPGVIFDLCAGVVVDGSWFRSRLRLGVDPRNRAAEVDTASDWWYVDDEAEGYFKRAGRHALYLEHLGKRIFVPQPDGDGADILDWLLGVAGPGSRPRPGNL